MLVDIEISRCVDAQIERAVPRDELQHVVEKANAGAHAVATAALERQPQRNLRLAGAAIDYRAAHSTSSITATARLVCSTTPVAIRRQPARKPARPNAFENVRPTITCGNASRCGMKLSPANSA